MMRNPDREGRIVANALASVLLPGTGVRGPAPDGASRQHRATSRARHATSTRGLEIAGVRPAAAGEPADRRTQTAVQPPDLLVVEGARESRRIDSRLPQRLVRDEVADPRQLRLVQQPRLDRDLRRPEDATERSQRD